MSRTIRSFDVLLSLGGLSLLSPFLILVFVVCLFDTGSPLFIQRRLGRGQQVFKLVKFRTMRKGIKSVPSHLLDPSDITPIGCLLRKTKIDELPQLWNVLRGDMSLVGPRPGLEDHHELRLARYRLGVFDVRPGITGLAQIGRVDMSDPVLLAKTDRQMIESLTFFKYFSYILITLTGNSKLLHRFFQNDSIRRE